MRGVLQRTGWLVAGVLLAVALLEIVLRCLPVSMPLHRSLEFARWPLQYTEPHLRWNYSIGWAMLNAHAGRTNNYGHVAPFDFKPHSRPVLVLGDSYIESLMNDYGQTLQAQLGQRIGAPESVYGMGVSGASASGYVGLARLARPEFEPRAAVVLVSDGDLSESLLPALGSHYLARRADGALELVYKPLPGVPLSTRLRQAVGDFSLHRYLQVNLQFAPENMFQALRPAAPVAAPRPADAAARVEQQQRVGDWFLEQLPDSLGVAPRCIVLLLDTDRYAIYKPELASTPKDAPAARAHLVDEARRRGFQVRELDPVFRELYARERLKFDHHPIDRHWNARGHGVAAAQAYQALAAAEGAGAACLPPSRPAP